MELAAAVLVERGSLLAEQTICGRDILFIINPVLSILTAWNIYSVTGFTRKTLHCNNPLFQSLLSESLSTQWKAYQCVRSSVWMCSSSSSFDWLSSKGWSSQPPSRKLVQKRFQFSFSFLGHVCRNENRQMLSTACSVLKLLLSHSGHHGPVVSYWFSESPITFPHNACHYLFSISLQLGFHLSWFLPAAVNAFLAVALHLTVKGVMASVAYSSESFKI